MRGPKQFERWLQEQIEANGWALSIQVYWLPVNASWLDQIEIWFLIDWQISAKTRTCTKEIGFCPKTALRSRDFQDFVEKCLLTISCSKQGQNSKLI